MNSYTNKKLSVRIKQLYANLVHKKKEDITMSYMYKLNIKVTDDTEVKTKVGINNTNPYMVFTKSFSRKELLKNLEKSKLENVTVELISEDYGVKVEDVAAVNALIAHNKVLTKNTVNEWVKNLHETVCARYAAIGGVGDGMMAEEYNTVENIFTTRPTLYCIFDADSLLGALTAENVEAFADIIARGKAVGISFMLHENVAGKLRKVLGDATRKQFVTFSKEKFNFYAS